MQHFSVVVDNEGQVNEAIARIWDKLQVRGELTVRPLDGKCKIEVISERDLTTAQLEKLPGKHS